MREGCVVYAVLLLSSIILVADSAMWACPPCQNHQRVSNSQRYQFFAVSFIRAVTKQWYSLIMANRLYWDTTMFGKSLALNLSEAILSIHKKAN